MRPHTVASVRSATTAPGQGYISANAGELLLVLRIEDGGAWVFARALAKHAGDPDSSGWIAASGLIIPPVFQIRPPATLDATHDVALVYDVIHDEKYDDDQCGNNPTKTQQTT